MDISPAFERLFLIIKFLGYVFVKVLVGIFVVPLSLIFQETYDWWQKKDGPLKWLLGIFYIPAAGFLFVFGAWWNDF